MSLQLYGLSFPLCNFLGLIRSDFFGPNNKLLNAHAMSKGTRVKAKKNMEDENEIGSDEIEVDLILSVKLEAK